jgi:hypothetical protein
MVKMMAVVTAAHTIAPIAQNNVKRCSISRKALLAW